MVQCDAEVLAEQVVPTTGLQNTSYRARWSLHFCSTRRLLYLQTL